MKYIVPILCGLMALAAPAAAQPCANPPGDEGDQVYNTTYHVMQYCNGSHWVAMGSIMGQGDHLGNHAATKTLDMGGHTIENLAVPVNAPDAVNKTYADTELAKKVNKAGDTMTGALNLSGSPTANAHAANKEYVDTVIASASGGAAINCTPVLVAAATCSCPAGFNNEIFSQSHASINYSSIPMITNIGGTGWILMGTAQSSFHYIVMGIPEYGLESNNWPRMGKTITHYPDPPLAPYCAKLCCQG